MGVSNKFHHFRTLAPCCEVSRGEKMALRGTEPASHITRYTLDYEDKSGEKSASKLTPNPQLLNLKLRTYRVFPRSQLAARADRPGERGAPQLRPNSSIPNPQSLNRKPRVFALPLTADFSLSPIFLREKRNQGGNALSPCCMHVKRFQGGLVSKAHRLVYRSTLGSRVIKKKKITLLRGQMNQERKAPPSSTRTHQTPIPFPSSVKHAFSHSLKTGIFSHCPIFLIFPSF